MNFIYNIIVLIISLSFSQLYANVNWQDARELYYTSLEDKSKVDSTIELFHNMRGENNSGLIDTYIGSLLAVKAKFSWLPNKKLSYAKKGLEIMDRGLENDPDNIEALFIHGSTCYYLPFFFKRKDDAIKNFRKIVQLLPEKFSSYPVDLVKNVIQFLEENIELTEDESAKLRLVKKRIANEL